MMLGQKKANLDLLCDDFQIYGFLDDGVIIRVLLHANTHTNKQTINIQAVKVDPG